MANILSLVLIPLCVHHVTYKDLNDSMSVSSIRWNLSLCLLVVTLQERLSDTFQHRVLFGFLTEPVLSGSHHNLLGKMVCFILSPHQSIESVGMDLSVHHVTPRE